MTRETLLVIGAAGDVGQGIVGAALASGRRVVAAGRNLDKLRQLVARHETQALACVAGDLTSEAGAARLCDEAEAAFGPVTHVVVSLNVPMPVQPLLQWSADALSASMTGNVLTHFTAAKLLLPRLPTDGLLIGIGGGTADFIFPQMVPVSMGQAALRMFYRGLAREQRGGTSGGGPGIRELMIVSMVNGASNREQARPDWITDADVGRHICAILDSPSAYPGPILQLRTREQVGQPEPAS